MIGFHRSQFEVHVATNQSRRQLQLRFTAASTLPAPHTSMPPTVLLSSRTQIASRMQPRQSQLRPFSALWAVFTSWQHAHRVVATTPNRRNATEALRTPPSNARLYMFKLSQTKNAEKACVYMYQRTASATSTGTLRPCS